MYILFPFVIFIFLNKVILVIYFPIFIVIWFLAMVDAREENRIKRFDKRIYGRFNIRMLLGILVLFGIIIACILIPGILDGIVSFVLFFFFVFVVIEVFTPFFKTPTWTNISIKRWFAVLLLCTAIFILIPFVTGFMIASKNHGEKIKIEFIDGKILQSSDNSQPFMIGKTKEFIFTLNKKDSTTSIYKIGDIKAITILTKVIPISEK